MKNTVFALAVFAASPLAAEPLRIATEGAFPPFSEINAAGELVGFDIDIANALCAEMKTECEIIAMDWDGIIPGLTAEKYDAIVASMSITEERMQTVDFTDPYYRNFLVVVAAEGADIAPDDISKHVIGAQRASISSSWAEEQMGVRGDLRLYDTATASFADLKAGRIDGFVSDYFPALDWLAENEGYAIAGERVDIDDQIGIALRKGENALKEELNTALENIVANGTYAEISMRYFGADIH